MSFAIKRTKVVNSLNERMTKRCNIIRANNVAGEESENKQLRRDSNPPSRGIYNTFATLFTTKPLDQHKLQMKLK